ncbi:uncharacterized protein N7529_003455 [Penicillium soppii]|uniref:uncharacterized protein n=1 Tax=Penicillium soppii TaxID=69789 RepID=UPI002546C464|nr:uncharacterized protein N7529_003455 [Penicillium soppii]KAJ5871102.1 hypothetical protein N7529_003455 [Penicillium soppii]
MVSPLPQKPRWSSFLGNWIFDKSKQVRAECRLHQRTILGCRPAITAPQLLVKPAASARFGAAWLSRAPLASVVLKTALTVSLKSFGRRTQKARREAVERRDPDHIPASDSAENRASDHESNPSIEISNRPNGQYNAATVPCSSYRTHDGEGGGSHDAIEVGTSSFQQPQSRYTRDTTVRVESEGDIENEERSGVEIATAALGQPQENGQIPFYTGGQTGPTYALDICSPEKSLPRHFLIPSHARFPLSDADQGYLQAKGVLTLPGKKSCESLLRAYLHHVHPLMPIIEVDTILEFQQNGRLHEYNLLLLWSIFFVAVNFVSRTVYEQEGYKSRKEMKASLYSRAKCMYAVGEGMDKIVLLQSSLLMGFWLSELDEHMQPLYWTGIAINLCQMLGLHRNPDSSKFNCNITDRQRSLWRRLWWSSFYRDRWLSLSFGRPSRIDLNDCDTPMPTATDLLVDVGGLPEGISAGFLPAGFPGLASYWVTLIVLSKQLGAVITMNYQTLKSRPTIQQFESREAEILRCTLPDQYQAGLTDLARFHSLHVHLHYQALLIAFYRPYGTDFPIDLDPVVRRDWQHRMRLRAGDAASKTNDIIDVLAEDNLLEYAGPMTPSLLVPAMQTHLLFYRSADSLTKRLRLHKLEMCMLIMEELQKVYTVASIYRGIFRKAMEQICPFYQATTAISDQGMSSARTTNTSGRDSIVNAAAAHQLPEAVFDNNYLPANSSEQRNELLGDFMDSLMDETSVFNFWETWNRM